MPTPLWVLLLFALWTLAIVTFAVGGYRIVRIATGYPVTGFPGGIAEGAPFYRRAMRAHMNCVETLPVYGAVALTSAITNVTVPLISSLAIAVLVGRIAQSSIHLAFPETKVTIPLRFLCFSVQVIAIAWMAVIVLQNASPALSP